MQGKKFTIKNDLSFNNQRSDLEKLTHTYSQLGRVQIPQFLISESAIRIHDCLSKQTEWNLSWNDQGEHKDLSYTGVMNWTEEQKILLSKKIYSQASERFQYYYSTIPIFDIYQNKLMPGHFFNKIYELINNPKLLSLVKQITGLENICFADIQATRFSAGHFLSEHDDDVRGKNRLAAYVLNLTPEWRNDWGGALILPGKEDSENVALFPKFNVLNIFSVPQKHSVSLVTEFAGAHRYSITGWFRY